MIRRYCAQDGGCTDPECHLCREVVRLHPQPPTAIERKQRDEYRRRVEAMKKGRKKTAS